MLAHPQHLQMPCWQGPVDFGQDLHLLCTPPAMTQFQAVLAMQEVGVCSVPEAAWACSHELLLQWPRRVRSRMSFMNPLCLHSLASLAPMTGKLHFQVYALHGIRFPHIQLLCRQSFSISQSAIFIPKSRSGNELDRQGHHTLLSCAGAAHAPHAFGQWKCRDLPLPL